MSPNRTWLVEGRRDKNARNLVAYISSTYYSSSTTLVIVTGGRRPIVFLFLCQLPLVFDVVKESRLEEVFPAVIRTLLCPLNRRYQWDPSRIQWKAAPFSCSSSDLIFFCAEGTMLATRSQSTEPPSHRITQLLIPQNKWILA
jgi:hypothetical protein